MLNWSSTYSFKKKLAPLSILVKLSSKNWLTLTFLWHAKSKPRQLFIAMKP